MKNIKIFYSLRSLKGKKGGGGLIKKRRRKQFLEIKKIQLALTIIYPPPLL